MLCGDFLVDCFGGSSVVVCTARIYFCDGNDEFCGYRHANPCIYVCKDSLAVPYGGGGEYILGEYRLDCCSSVDFGGDCSVDFCGDSLVCLEVFFGPGSDLCADCMNCAAAPATTSVQIALYIFFCGSAMLCGDCLADLCGYF